MSLEAKRFSIEMLHPHPLNEKLYPADEGEDKELEKSIRENGILEKLVAMPEGTIISGARRWRIAKKLGITHLDCELRVFEDPEQAIIEYNRYRKKTPRVIANELAFIRQKLEQKAKEQQGTRTDLLSNLTKSPIPEPPLESIHVRDKAAEILDVSGGQLYKIDYIYGHEDIAKPVVEKLDRGEISVHQAFTEVKKAVEAPKAESKPKTWKCGVCLQEQDADVEPVNLTVCPDCAMDFQTWKADKEP